MSHEATAGVRKAVRGLTTAERLVLLDLAERAGPAGRCWPSVQTIAAENEMDRRTVQRSLRDLNGGVWCGSRRLAAAFGPPPLTWSPSVARTGSSSPSYGTRGRHHTAP